MAKIEVVDDCLYPRRYVVLNYNGKNPWSLVKKVTEKVRPYFRLKPGEFSHYRLNWDDAGDPVFFFSRWWAVREFSRWSRMHVEFKINGEEYKTTKDGWFAFEVEASLLTEFHGWGLFLKPIWYFYTYIFYNKLKRNYLFQCRNMVNGFMDEIKKDFHLQVDGSERVEIVGQ